MNYKYLFKFILPLILSTLFEKGLCDDDEDDVKYVAWFSDDVSDCKDYENKMLVADLAMEPIENDDDDSMLMGLSGSLTVEDEMKEGMMMNLDISMIKSDNDKEMMFSISMDFCKSLDDDDAPWKEVLAQIGITECPVPKKKFDVKGLLVDLAWMQDHLTRKNVGSYGMELKFMNERRDVMSCHQFDVDIDQENK